MTGWDELDALMETIRDNERETDRVSPPAVIFVETHSELYAPLTESFLTGRIWDDNIARVKC